jgi:hypothetical protein
MCACVPPPPSRIARCALKMRVKTIGWGPQTRPNRCVRPCSPPRPIHRKGQKYSGGPLVFSLHTCATVLTHWYLIGLIIKFG